MDEQIGTGIDLSEGAEKAPDPFEDIPANPNAGLEEGELPPGVQQGHLPGDNPSEEEPEPVAEEEEPTVLDEVEKVGAALEVPETEVEESEEPEKSAEEAEVEAEEEQVAKTEEAPVPAGVRGYVILREGAEPGEWIEAFDRPDPESDEPFVMMQRNGTAAVRKAYRMLSEGESDPQEYVLMPIPRKLFQPKRVAGRVHKQTAISVS
jgi:nucleotide-binding universal stress UspA family protein